MSYTISKPSPQLWHIVKFYWSLENCQQHTHERIQRIIPNGLTELTFHFKAIPEVLDSGVILEGSSYVSGLSNRFYDLKINKEVSLFSVVFQPIGLAILLDIPMSELFNQHVNLKHLIKESSQLEERLFEASSFEKRISIMNEFFTGKLKKEINKNHVSRIHSAFNLISNSKALIKVEELASETCLSRKQFERVFTDFVGTSPKRFLKIVRFQNAIYQKGQLPKCNLTYLAHQCGYFDQAHMTNDFIELSGMGPKKFFSTGESFSDYFE